MILELICANLVNFSINVCNELPTPEVALDREVVALNNTFASNSLDEAVYLAKGRPYESDYRREVDERRRQEEIRSRDDRYRRDERYRENRDCYDDDDDDRHHDYREGRDYRRERECEREREERRGPIYRIFHR